MPTLSIFGLGESRDFAIRIAKKFEKQGFDAYGPYHYSYGNPYRSIVEQTRPDGECYARSIENVRGHDAFVVASLYDDPYESVNDKLVRLLIFINSLRHASAARITVVVPYLCYMRQDRKTESRAPIATQALAASLEAVGVDRVLMMDAHNPGAEQNAFRIPVDILEARKLLADEVARLMYPGIAMVDQHVPPVVLSPDAGGVERANLMRASLEKRIGRRVEFAYAHKQRKSATEVDISIIGDVKDRNVIMVDDMISTGGTAAQAKNAVEDAGGRWWGIVATHGLFVGDAHLNLAYTPNIVIADTVRPWRLEEKLDIMPKEWKPRLTVVDTAALFASAIKAIHEESGSISSLLKD